MNNRYNAVYHSGKVSLNDNINDCTMREASHSPEAFRAMKAMAKKLNEYADDKDNTRRIASATVAAISSMSVNFRSRFDTLELVLAKALRADHWHARPRNEWERIANALDHDYLANCTPREIDAAWRRMVRCGFVRSYQKRGQRLYELNLVTDVEQA